MMIQAMIEIVPYDSDWPRRFARLGRELREALGDAAVRIDHIGSTAVPGLAAKPVIDVQISVVSFVPLDRFRAPLVRAHGSSFRRLARVGRADRGGRGGR
jgi:GrpB-like predicted nucleotidyltransferase (UPF0157 family)